MQTNLHAALDYAGRGYSVIPIGPNKRPLIKWTEFQSRIASKEEITRYWTRYPLANVGIVTGPISGILVVDCDDADAYRRVQELLPDSLIIPVAKTPRGWHLYFIYPAGSKITTGAGIMPGVDFRGEGGYIIAPPSVNGDGKAYAWEDGLSLQDTAPAPLPPAVVNIFNSTFAGAKNV